MSKVWDGLNGKKIPITLVILAIGTISTWAVTNYKVGEHDKVLKPMPAQIAVMQQQIEDGNAQFKEFRTEYKKDQRALDGKMERIWQAVK